MVKCCVLYTATQFFNKLTKLISIFKYITFLEQFFSKEFDIGLASINYNSIIASCNASEGKGGHSLKLKQAL